MIYDGMKGRGIFLLSSNTTFLAVKAWLKESNMLVQHRPTLLSPTCCTRLATMLHQTSPSTSFNVSFVLRSEQQCGICLAITWNSVARALALRLSVSMMMVYSLHLFRALPRQFNLQNGERA